LIRGSGAGGVGSGDRADVGGCRPLFERAVPERLVILDPRFQKPPRGTMASFRVELDAPNNIVLVMVAEDDGSEHDYQFDFDPRSGRYEFSERDLLERDFGEEWVEDMDNQVRAMIQKALASRK
jgi:hypothetical protein